MDSARSLPEYDVLGSAISETTNACQDACPCWLPLCSCSLRSLSIDLMGQKQYPNYLDCSMTILERSVGKKSRFEKDTRFFIYHHCVNFSHGSFSMGSIQTMYGLHTNQQHVISVNQLGTLLISHRLLKLLQKESFSTPCNVLFCSVHFPPILARSANVYISL